jgi:hypothetical protein
MRLFPTIASALPVRRSFAVLAAAVLASSFLSFAATARAEGEELTPDHSSYDMTLAEGSMPAGWSLVKEGGAADENAVKDAISAIAKDKGLVTAKDAKVHYFARSATTVDGKKAVFILMDLDAKSDPFTNALKDAAAGKGWSYREMGAATRLLVVSAPADVLGKAVELQTSWALKQLSTLAMSKIEGRFLPQGEAVAKAALAIDGKFAAAHFALGFYVEITLAGRADSKVAIDDGISHYRAALGKDATGEFSAGQRARTQGQLGGLLLQKGGPSVEARDLLKEAVAAAASLKRDDGLVYQYNLACAHARLKEIDDAFKQLTPVLEENAKSVIGGIHWIEDEDFDGLHSDARWEELKKKYPATSHTTGDGV